MSEPKPLRPEGYYWVVQKGEKEPEVAYYGAWRDQQGNAVSYSWEITGYVDDFQDDNFSVIHDYRLAPPITFLKIDI